MRVLVKFIHRPARQRTGAAYKFAIATGAVLATLATPSRAIILGAGLWLVSAAHSPIALAVDPAPSKLTVMTWNVEWMFDDQTGDNRSDLARQQSAPTKEYWNWKVAAVAEAIFKADAAIVALQEIESERTLTDVVVALKTNHQAAYRFAFIQGFDGFTEQDVGLLFKNGLIEYKRHEQSREMFDSEQYYNLSKHLVGLFQWKNAASPLTVMTAYFRATAEAEALRVRQARLARYWLAPALDSGRDVILMGDLNTERWVDDLSAEMGVLVNGDGAGSSATPMVDLLKHASPESRRTHLILDDQFDRILVSPNMMVDDPGSTDWVFENIAVRPELAIRGTGPDGPAHWDQRLTTPTSELDVSDHYPVVASFILK